MTRHKAIPAKIASPNPIYAASNPDVAHSKPDNLNNQEGNGMDGTSEPTGRADATLRGGHVELRRSLQFVVVSRGRRWFRFARSRARRDKQLTVTSTWLIVAPRNKQKRNACSFRDGRLVNSCCYQVTVARISYIALFLTLRVGRVLTGNK